MGPDQSRRARDLPETALRAALQCSNTHPSAASLAGAIVWGRGVLHGDVNPWRIDGKDGVCGGGVAAVAETVDSATAAFDPLTRALGVSRNSRPSQGSRSVAGLVNVGLGPLRGQRGPGGAGEFTRLDLHPARAPHQDLANDASAEQATVVVGRGKRDTDVATGGHYLWGRWEGPMPGRSVRGRPAQRRGERLADIFGTWRWCCGGQHLLGRAPARPRTAQPLRLSRYWRRSWAASSTRWWRHSAPRYWQAIKPMRWRRRKSVQARDSRSDDTVARLSRSRRAGLCTAARRRGRP